MRIREENTYMSYMTCIALVFWLGEISIRPILFEKPKTTLRRWWSSQNLLMRLMMSSSKTVKLILLLAITMMIPSFTHTNYWVTSFFPFYGKWQLWYVIVSRQKYHAFRLKYEILVIHIWIFEITKMKWREARLYIFQIR